MDVHAHRATPSSVDIRPWKRRATNDPMKEPCTTDEMHNTRIELPFHRDWTASQCTRVQHGPMLRVGRARNPTHSRRQTEGASAMAVKTIEELFIHELSDIYSAEKQLTKALPRLARAADNEELAEGFRLHLEETQGQIERIDQIVDLLDIRLKRIKCAAMEGLVEEGKEVIDAIEAGPLRDAALIGGAQKVEHYEIAAYGTLAALAKQLGYKDALPLILETLEEEKATDQKLTLLAEQGGNQRAAQQRDAA